MFDCDNDFYIKAFQFKIEAKKLKEVTTVYNSFVITLFADIFSLA